jgi:hypothetical protein
MANECAIHAKRVTVQKKDIDLVRRIRGDENLNRMVPFKEYAIFKEWKEGNQMLDPYAKRRGKQTRPI